MIEKVALIIAAENHDCPADWQWAYQPLAREIVATVWRAMIDAALKERDSLQ